MISGDRAEFDLWFEEVWPGRPQELEHLHTYGEALLGSSKRMSLISRGDQSRLYMRHLRECSDPAFVNLFPASVPVLDVGSGNGLPGLVLAILREDLAISLLEPRLRRSAFLQRSVFLTRATNATVLENSIERLQPKPGGQWEWSVSRALRWTPVMISALEACSGENAAHIRFGGAGLTPREYPLSADRALQVWPRSQWAELAGKDASERS